MYHCVCFFNLDSTCVGQKSGGNLIDYTFESTIEERVEKPDVSNIKTTHSGDEVSLRKRIRKNDEDDEDDFVPEIVSSRKIHEMKMHVLQLY